MCLSNVLECSENLFRKEVFHVSKPIYTVGFESTNAIDLSYYLSNKKQLRQQS